MFNNESLRALAMEILKAKCDLKNSTNEEILNCYFNIWKELKIADSKISEPSLKVLK